MAHNRAQLNALIFHNEVVLPRTSPGFAEVTLAVAELQGGNNAKAALYAEAAYLKDPTLAAAWLAKTAADVFEATPDDLRKERALFCMDRALECVPSCRREITEFFVGNILGHYVEVLCTGALDELAHWLALEAQADDLEGQATQFDWQAAQLHTSATLLEAAGLVTGLVALFSRRLGTRLLSGVASVTAFSEAARTSRDAALLAAMGSHLRAAGDALRLEGSEHRAASMLSLVPARDLIAVGAQLLHAEGLPPQPLDRLVQAFTDGFRQVLGGQLGQLCGEIGIPTLDAIRGDRQSLVASYGGPPGPGKTKQTRGPYEEVHPLSRGTVLWLEHLLPGVSQLDAYPLLSRPLPTISRWVYGFGEGTHSRSLPERMVAADESLKMKTGGLTLVALACLFFAPFAALLPGAGVIYYVVKTKQRERARVRVRAIFDSLWSVDTWLRAPLADSLPGVLGPSSPPPLPVGVQAGGPGAKASRPRLTVAVVVGGTLLLSLLTLVVLLALVGSAATDPSAAKKAADSTAAAMAHGTGAATPPAPTVRRALPVPSRSASSPAQVNLPSTSNPAGDSYTVIDVAEGDPLNVRAGPGVNHDVVARLPKGTNHVQVTGAPVMNGPTEWVPIRTGERTGWVTKAHLQRE